MRPFYHWFIYTGKHQTETTAKSRAGVLPYVWLSFLLHQQVHLQWLSSSVSKKYGNEPRPWMEFSCHVRLPRCTCHVVHVGSIVAQIGRDRNPIAVESLCNYVIKMYWFKPEGSIRLSRLVPQICCIVLCLGVLVRRRWSAVCLSVCLSVCLLHSVPTPLGCKAHS